MVKSLRELITGGGSLREEVRVGEKLDWKLRTVDEKLVGLISGRG